MGEASSYSNIFSQNLSTSQLVVLVPVAEGGEVAVTSVKRTTLAEVTSVKCSELHEPEPVSHTLRYTRELIAENHEVLRDILIDGVT